VVRPEPDQPDRWLRPCNSNPLCFRWLKSWNISTAPEHEQRSLAQELTGGVKGEYAVFSFGDRKRGDLLKKAPCVWVENLEQKIIDTLEHSDR